MEDMFTFVNVGFTKDVGNIKFLVCADCEVGPTGWHSFSGMTRTVSTWLWTGFPMSDGGGGRSTPAIKAFPGTALCLCSALTSIVSATRPSSSRPTPPPVASAGRLLRSFPLRSPGSRDTVLPQISSRASLPRRASLSPTQELAAVRP